MASPLNSSDLSQLKAIDQNLDEAIRQSQSGSTNMSDVAAIQQQLASLAKNPEIPENVQESLQAALTQLKQVASGGVNTSSLYSAKMQVDQILDSTQH